MKNRRKSSGNMMPVVVIILVAILALPLFLLIFKGYNYISIYPYPLSADDISKISSRLSEMKIPYKVIRKKGQVIVSPDNRRKARMSLALYALPQISSNPDENVSELTVQMIKKLEYALSKDIRQLEALEDAVVKISSRPAETGSGNVLSASVAIKMKPGVELSPPQVRGIIHILVYTVKGLEPSGIALMDTGGNNLIRLYNPDDDPEGKDSEIGKYLSEISTDIGEERENTKRVQELKAREFLNERLVQGHEVLSSIDTMTFLTEVKETSEILEKKSEKILDDFLWPGAAAVYVSIEKDAGARIIKSKNVVIFVQPLKPEFIPDTAELIKKGLGLDIEGGDTVTVCTDGVPPDILYALPLDDQIK